MFKFTTLEKLSTYLMMNHIKTLRREQNCVINRSAFDYLIQRKDINSFIDNLTWQKLSIKDAFKYLKKDSAILLDEVHAGFIFVTIQSANHVKIVAFRDDIQP